MRDLRFFVSKAGLDQLHITAAIDTSTESAPAVAETIYRKIASVLDDHNMRVLHERVFGNLEFYEQFKEIRKRHFGFAEGPFSYIQGKPCRGGGLAGIQINAVKPVSNEDFWIIYDDNSPCGYGWKREDSTYIHLAGITGSVPESKQKKDQASSMFADINRILGSQGLSFRDVKRTWIYLGDILTWYDDFNSIRNERFKGLKLIPSDISGMEIDQLYLPASTGISGDNPQGTASLSDVLAISGNIGFSVLPGVRQHSAYRYGSAFSRGVCIEEKDYRQILVSGTAAIDEDGKSLYLGNIEKQIERTIEIVEELIGGKGAKLSDIRSATVYLKRPDDLSIYRKIAAKHDLENMPAIVVNADICREELLFEMDAVAVIDKPYCAPDDA